MNEHDEQLIDDMGMRLEASILWLELSTLLTPAWHAPVPSHGVWRCYPTGTRFGDHRVMVSDHALAVLRNVNGKPSAESFDSREVKTTMRCLLDLLESCTVEVEA